MAYRYKLEPGTMHAQSIRNKAWLVRYYRRGARSIIGQQERAKAISDLGAAVRDAFNDSPPSDYELLLIALVDSLHPRDEPPF